MYLNVSNTLKLKQAQVDKIETNTHNEHQEQLPHKKEYSQGSSGETIKTREKPEAIHSPTNATKQHNNYSEQGFSKPETSL